MNTKKDSLLSGRVKVVTIQPSYTYIGEVVDRDFDFIYLDTKDYEGVIALQINNILRVIKNKEVDKHG